MKKLVIITALILGNSSWAFADANNATQALSSGLSSATATNPAPAAATATDYQSRTTSTITLIPRDNLIIATATTSWDPKASDNLAIRWLAPKGYCQSSNFNMTRGPNTSHDVFWAYRTVVHTTSKGTTVTCQGHWVAEVINVNTGKVLATAGYDVVPNNKPPLSGDTTVSDNSNSASVSAQ
jgi:hypothetical protein